MFSKEENTPHQQQYVVETLTMRSVFLICSPTLSDFPNGFHNSHSLATETTRRYYTWRGVFAPRPYSITVFHRGPLGRHVAFGRTDAMRCPHTHTELFLGNDDDNTVDIVSSAYVDEWKRDGWMDGWMDRWMCYGGGMAGCGDPGRWAVATHVCCQ